MVVALVLAAFGVGGGRCAPTGRRSRWASCRGRRNCCRSRRRAISSSFRGSPTGRTSLRTTPTTRRSTSRCTWGRSSPSPRTSDGCAPAPGRLAAQRPAPPDRDNGQRIAWFVFVASIPAAHWRPRRERDRRAPGRTWQIAIFLSLFAGVLWWATGAHSVARWAISA